jgi:hypothetical protein
VVRRFNRRETPACGRLVGGCEAGARAGFAFVGPVATDRPLTDPGRRRQFGGANIEIPLFRWRRACNVTSVTFFRRR